MTDKKLRIAGMSDIHGKLNHTAPDCDILAIVGDIMPLLSSAENWKQWQELAWVETQFVRWLHKQTFEHCLIVWGNHDIAAMAPDTRQLLNQTLCKIPGLQILDHDTPSAVIDGVRFSGYPYTPTIRQRNWAFSLPRGDERVRWSLDHYIHPETDVLLSHGPPNGFLDYDLANRGDLGFGCGELTKKIIEVAPRLVMCGHIHECRGKRAWMWNNKGQETRLINVSICDADYSERGAKVQVYEI